MKAVILAGGYGTRLSEETVTKPKPMVEVGDKPILWHIMKMYSSHGINDFIICLGYKGYIIKEFFSNYYLHTSDVSFDLQNNTMDIHNSTSEPWRVTLVDTGEGTFTGGRVKRIQKYVDGEEFCLTYGDGVSDINITSLINFHQEHKKLATLTAVRPPGRFGAIEIQNSKEISSFMEKPSGDGSYINGGFFVLSSKIFDFIEGDDTVWEREPLENLSKQGQLMAFEHDGFWLPMDTLRDKQKLEELWASAKAPWKSW